MIFLNQALHQVRADKTCSSGDKNIHHTLLCRKKTALDKDKQVQIPVRTPGEVDESGFWPVWMRYLSLGKLFWADRANLSTQIL